MMNRLFFLIVLAMLFLLFLFVFFFLFAEAHQMEEVALDDVLLMLCCSFLM